MSRVIFFFSLAILAVSLVSAAPGAGTRALHFWEKTRPSTFIDFVGKRNTRGEASVCDLSRAKMPIAPTPLPSPDANLSLAHVAIGRGTQNYTCDLQNTTAIPVPIGAVASLFNVSCIAASAPSLLSLIPSIALDAPLPSSPAADADLMGHHYFLNASTPFFNLDTDAHAWGAGAFQKVNSTAAPKGAMKGVGGVGEGAVAWLKLMAMDPGGSVLQEVYRVNTAGGSPPKTCGGMVASFEVEYAAEYWVYEKAD